MPLITHHLAAVVDDALPHHLPSRSSVRLLHCPVAVASVGVADGAFVLENISESVLLIGTMSVSLVIRSYLVTKLVNRSQRLVSLFYN